LVRCERIRVLNGNPGLSGRLLYRFARGTWNRRHLVPDQYSAWGAAVTERATEYVESGGFRPDVLVTFAQPFTDHLIGLELKRRFGLPWLAHFSDPWVDNPFTPFDDAVRARNLALERSVAENADALVFTSGETVDVFCSKYSAEIRAKARVLPQCFDPAQFAEQSRTTGAGITVRYLGNFYGRRSPRPLVTSLARLYRENSGLLEGVRFELIGSGDFNEANALAAGLPDGLLTVRPSVSYRESLELMVSADGLLIIDAPAEISVFLPSKLIDYIGAGRPVFGITPKGTAARLIEELGGITADPGDETLVCAGLSRFVQTLRSARSGSTDAWGNRCVRERYTAERVSADFLEMLKEIRTD
jgi:hypothetical protein